MRRPVSPFELAVAVRRSDDLEVAGVVVGHQVEVIAAVLNRIFDVRTARRDDPCGGRRIRGRDRPPFRRREPVVRDEDVLVAARADDVDVVEDVVFLEHLGVLRARRTEHVTPDGIAALGLVRCHVEERLVVVGPGRAVPDALDRFEDLSGGQVLDVERVLAERGEVLEVDDLRAVGTDLEAAKCVELLALRQHVLIEIHLLRRVWRALPATEDWISFPLFRARVIPVAVFPDRHLLVGLLDSSEHLFVQRVLQRREVPRAGGRVGVLGVEVRLDGGRVLLAQPGVVVGQGDAIDCRGLRDFLRDRRIRRRLARQGDRHENGSSDCQTRTTKMRATEERTCHECLQD